MQVVLLHYVSAFLPAIALTYPLATQDLWPTGLFSIPFVYAYEGHSAVYLFFVMSGVVLTQAFSSATFRLSPAVVRRAIRLGLPMIAATLFAAALFVLFPEAHRLAAQRTGSSFFRDLGPSEISGRALAHQIVFEGMLAGFDSSSLLPHWLRRSLTLAPLSSAFNAPLWTLHAEFCGSLLIMILVTLRSALSRGAHLAICTILLTMSALSPMSLFIAGHLLADYLTSRRALSPRPWLGSALLAGGIFLGSVRATAPIAYAWRFLPVPWLGLPGNPLVLQVMVGALCVFTGLCCLPALRRNLEHPALRWLGKISFSLYLTHCPILLTGMAWAFDQFHQVLPYAVNVSVVAIGGLAVSIATAVVFERLIDQTSIRLSRSAGHWCRTAMMPRPTAA
jgi:peptidoglycan/LPS O-acetylase OafA/YrhL